MIHSRAYRASVPTEPFGHLLCSVDPISLTGLVTALGVGGEASAAAGGVAAADVAATTAAAAPAAAAAAGGGTLGGIGTALGAASAGAGLASLLGQSKPTPLPPPSTPSPQQQPTGQPNTPRSQQPTFLGALATPQGAQSGTKSLLGA